MPSFQVQGIRIHYLTLGHGAPVLMLHGGPGMNYRSMLPLKNLAKDFQLVFLDQRGSGRSALPDLSTLTFDHCVSDLECLREILGIDRWTVVGHSFGGFVGLEYAIRFPKRVTRLVLIDTGYRARQVQEMAPQRLLTMGYSERVATAAHRFFNGRVPYWQTFFVFLRFSPSYFYGRRLMPLVRSLTGKHRMKTAWYWFRHTFSDWDLSTQLQKIEAPTLIVAGRYDFQFPEDAQMDMSRRIHQSRVVIIDQTGHNTPMECPDQVVSHIRQFLSEDIQKASTA